MKYREDIENFCKANGLEIYFDSIVEVFLDELDCCEDDIEPSDDVDDLLCWEDTNQGHKFWMSVYWGTVLDKKDKEWFIKTLYEYCPMPTVKVFKYEDS